MRCLGSEAQPRYLPVARLQKRRHIYKAHATKRRNDHGPLFVFTTTLFPVIFLVFLPRISVACSFVCAYVRACVRPRTYVLLLPDQIELDVRAATMVYNTNRSTAAAVTTTAAATTAAAAAAAAATPTQHFNNHNKRPHHRHKTTKATLTTATTPQHHNQQRNQNKQRQLPTPKPTT